MSANSRALQKGLQTLGEGCQHSLLYTPSIPHPSGFNKPLSLESVITRLLVVRAEAWPRAESFICLQPRLN